MNILLVSEGKHEIGADAESGALVTLVRRLLDKDVSITREKVSSRAVRVHLLAGKGGGYFKRASAWLRYAQKNGYDAIILVVDQDGDTSRRGQLDKAQDHLIFHIQRALGVAVRMFDAWMLADEVALSKVLNTTIPKQPEPEGIKQPKTRCEQLRNDSGADLSLTSMYSAIAHQADLHLLEARCPDGFAPFSSRVRAL